MFYRSAQTKPYMWVISKTKILRLGAQSVTLLSTLRDPTQLRQRQCACACYALFEWKKTQILIAHQKERIDRTKKVRLAAKRGFCTHFLLLTTPYGMFEWKKNSNSYRSSQAKNR